MRTTDPVCGMPVAEGQGIRLQHGETVVVFCTEFCRQQFLRHPGAYAPAAFVRPPVVADLRLALRKVAYFSMEVALDPRVPTYSGGLGVLAGDTLRSAADLGIPMIGITLVHREGYFRQEIRDGSQFERPARWSPEELLTRFDPMVEVSIEGRRVRIAAWRMDVVGSGGHVVPLVLLDTDLPDNAAQDRALARWLYGGDARYRLGQEVVLGIGGVRMVRALGCTGLGTYHLNEGHAAFAPLEILRTEQGGRSESWDFLSIRNRCVFTTHTPVAAGHDRFERGMVRAVLGELVPDEVLWMLGGREELNMTQLALNLSHYDRGRRG